MNVNFTNAAIAFAEPAWLAVGLAACTGIVLLLVRASRLREAALRSFASGHLLGKLAANFSPRRRRAKAVLLVAGIACLFVSLARPRWGSVWEEVHRRGIDILLALDTSKSMLAPDVAPDRLGRAKLGIHDFVGRLEGDRVGLLPFAGQAYLLCPLTLDYDAFRESLAAVDTSIVPVGGTDLAGAIKAAEKAFEDGSNHKILVVLTDGEDLEGEALAAAKAAAENGVTVHTVGIGTPNGELIPLPGGGFVEDEHGKPVRSSLDEDALRRVAEATGGVYAPLGNRAEGLDTIYRERLALVPEEDFGQRMKEVPVERFQWPLAIGIVLLMVEFLVRPGRRQTTATAASYAPANRRHQPAPPAGATAVAAAIAALMLGTATQQAQAAGPAHDPRKAYNSGTEHYEAGDWDAAAESFSASLSTGDVSLQNRAYYNLGNTGYRQGQAALATGDTETTKTNWQAAIDHFANALALDPDDDDARFNKEFVEKKLEELEQQEQDQQQDQQDEQNQDENQEGESQNQEDQSGSGEDQNEGSDQGSEEEDENEDKDEEGSENSDQSGEGQEDPANEQEESGAKGDDERDQAGDEAGEDEQQPEPADGDEKPEPNEQETDQRQPGDDTTPEPKPGDEEADQAKPQAGPEQPADQVANPADYRAAPGAMSAAEAEQLLESLLDGEASFQIAPLPVFDEDGKLVRPRRDW